MVPDGKLAPLLKTRKRRSNGKGWECGIERFGCPNPFDVELSPDMVQLGRRLSQEIANIQNNLQTGDLAESDASLLARGGGLDVRLSAKTRGRTPPYRW
jgi:hypothetical protein